MVDIAVQKIVKAIQKLVFDQFYSIYMFRSEFFVNIVQFIAQTWLIVVKVNFAPLEIVKHDHVLTHFVQFSLPDKGTDSIEDLLVIVLI